MLATATADPSRLPPLPGASPRTAAASPGEAPFQVHFPQGLPGFPMVNDYLLRPASPSSDLLVLAAVGHAQLRFLVIPYVPGWLPVDHADLTSAAEAAKIAEADLAIVLLVNIQRDPLAGTADITVNLRAPILVDTATRIAIQHVLARPDYSIRYPLRRLAGAPAAARTEG